MKPSWATAVLTTSRQHAAPVSPTFSSCILRDPSKHLLQHRYLHQPGRESEESPKRLLAAAAGSAALAVACAMAAARVQVRQRRRESTERAFSIYARRSVRLGARLVAKRGSGRGHGEARIGSIRECVCVCRCGCVDVRMSVRACVRVCVCGCL